jgi:hypothetical protein
VLKALTAISMAATALAMTSPIRISKQSSLMRLKV